MPGAPQGAEGGIFDFDQKQERLTEVELELGESLVWEKPEYAQALGKERSELEKIVLTIRNLEQSFSDIQELIDLAREEDDESLLQEALSDLESTTGTLETLELQQHVFRCHGQQ